MEIAGRYRGKNGHPFRGLAYGNRALSDKHDYPRAAGSMGASTSTEPRRLTNAGASHLLRALLLIVVAGGGIYFASSAQAASITWVGLGSTNNWSEGANWSTGVAPTSIDIAIFNATSSKNATINAAVNVGGIQIDTGYTGTVTQASVTTTVGASGFQQAGGTFLGSSSGITVNGSFTLSSGSFTSTAGTLSVSGAFTHGGGTFAPNGGTVTFTGSAATVDVPGTESFNNLRFAPTTAGAVKTITAGTTLIAQGTLTLTEGAINTGTVAARGDISQASSFDGGTGLLTIDGTGAQSFTGAATTAAGALPNLDIAKPSGTLTLTGTIRTNRNWTVTSGTVNPTTSTIIYAGTLTITGSQTLNTIEIRGAVTVPAATTLTITNLTMPSAVAFTVNGSVTVTGTTALTDGSITGAGNVVSRGDISQASTFDGGTGLLTIDGTGAQSFTGAATTAAGALPNLDIAKPSGTLTLTGTIRTNRNWTVTSGTVNPTTSTIIYAGTLTITGSQTLNTIEIRGAVTVPAATTLTITNLTMPSAVAFTVNGSVTVTGTTALTDGSITGAGNVVSRGDISQASTFDGGTGLLTIDGTGAQSFTGAATTAAGALPNLDIAKPSGTLTLTGTIRTNRNWTHTSGTVNPTTSTIIYAGTLTITGSQTLTDVIFNGGNMTYTVAAGTTLTITGTTALTDGSITGAGNVVSRGDISQASTFDGGTGLLTIDGTGAQSFTGAATTAAGALPNLDIAKPSGTLTLTGTIRTNRNWTHTSGTVNPTTSTIIYAGTLTITGSQTLTDVIFNGGNMTYTVAAGTTLTITGTTALTDGSITGAGNVVSRGDISQASTFDGGTGLLTIDGTGAQSFTGAATTAAGALPNLDIAKPSGTLTLTGTIRTNRNWTHTSGTVNPTTSTIIYAGTLTITGSQTLTDVIFNGGNMTYTVAAGTTLTITGTTALTDGSITGAGNVVSRGDISQASTFDGGTGLLTIDGTGAQSFTGAATTAAGALPNLDIAKPSGTLTLTGTIRTNRNWTVTSGTVNPTTSTIIYAGTLTITGSQTLNTIEIRGAVTVPAATTLTITNLTMPSAVAFTVNGSVTVTGTTALTDGSITGAGNVVSRGDISQASTFDGGTGLLTIDGTGAQSFTGAATTAAGALPNLDIAKPSGTLTLTGTIRTNRNWTVTSGTVNPTTSTIIYAGTLTITGSQTLNTIEIRGAVTVPAATTLTITNLTMPSAVAFTVNGSVTVTGTTALTDGSITGAGNVVSRGDISQASTFDGGTGLLTIDGTGAQSFTGAATTAAGALPNLDIAKPSGTLTLTGTIRTNRNWTVTSGTVNPTTSTIIFAGNQQVSVAAGIAFSSVTVDSGALASGVTLMQGPLVVNGTLTLSSGTITTGGSKVVVTSTGNVVRSSGHVIGDLQKYVPTGSAVSVDFEIGDVTAYTPVVVLFGTVTTSGDLLASTSSGDHPDVAASGVSATNGANRWWTITSSGAGFDYYDVAFDFVAADLDPFADTSEFIVAKRDGATWTQPVVLARSATSIEAGGLTSFSEFVVGEPAADVGVSIVGSPDPVLVGGTLTHTVTVHNAGPSPASNVVLTYPLPAGVAYQSVTSSQGSCSQSSGTVTCALGNLAANATATVTIRVTATTPGPVTNTVTTTATETDPQTPNNTASWTSTINPAADVGVSIVGSPDPVLVGGTLTHTVTVHNAGPSPASNVVLTYPLPAGVAYQSVTSSQGSCSQSSGTVTCALGNLAANATATVTIRVTATTPGPVTNTVTITATETDPQTPNNTASWTSTINPAADVGVSIVGSPDPVLVGGTLTHTVTVHNAGPSPASNVVLTYPLPAGVAYQSVTSSQGSCSQSSGTVTCALGNLAANATATVTIRVTATTPGPVTNTVTITATETDPQTPNNTASWTSTINPAAEPEPEPTEDPTPTVSNGTDSKTPRRHGVPWSPDLRHSNETPEADPQPSTEPESEANVDGGDSTVRPDQVLPLAENAESTEELIGNTLSTALILSMLWVGPLLFIVIRRWLRRQTD